MLPLDEKMENKGITANSANVNKKNFQYCLTLIVQQTTTQNVNNKNDN